MLESSKLVRIIAGNNFTVEEHEDPNIFTFTHNKCGNKFTRELNHISQYGIKCPRCDEVITTKALRMHIDATVALKIYQECKELLPKEFSIVGDTSSKDNTVKIITNSGRELQVVINDLLENINLPDCLLRRGDIHSIQLELIDRILPSKYLILDDFQTLNTFVRVKNQETLTISSCRVEDLLSEVLPHE